MEPTLYKAVWYWNSDTGRLEYEGQVENKTLKSGTTGTGLGDSYTNIEFQENVDQKMQKHFKLNYQRVVPPEIPAVVTLQDIKDVVTFLMMGSIPKNVLCLLHSDRSNKLYRALIIYFQLYLKIWEDLKYRKLAYFTKRLKHPVAVERETLCRKHLSSLRVLIGYEYASLVTGAGFYNKFHHMNNHMNRSYNSKDVVLYDYLFKFASRVVWISLFRSNFKEIELELARLFSYTPLLDKKKIKSLQLFMDKSDRSVLFGDEYKIKFNSLTPVVVNIFSNEYKGDGFHSKIFDCDKNLAGIEALMNFPEEMIKMLGLTLGILGHAREDYEPTLYMKQQLPKTLEEEDFEKARTPLLEPEKPLAMMYRLLEDLDRTIDLQRVAQNEEISCKKIGEMATVFQENHIEDSKQSYSMWKRVKSP